MKEENINNLITLLNKLDSNSKVNDFINILEQVNTKTAIQEFIQVFSVAINAFVDMKKDIKDRHNGQEMSFKLELENLKDNIRDVLNDRKNELNVDITKELVNLEKKLLETIDEKIPEIPEIDEDKLKKDILKDIPEQEYDDGDDIIEKINDDDTSKKIKRERIEGLENLIKSKSFGGGGLAVKNSVMVYDLSDSLDGATKTFKLPAFWRVLNVQSTSFPNAFRPTVDYTTDGANSTITFTSEITAGTTLASGQSILVMYVSL